MNRLYWDEAGRLQQQQQHRSASQQLPVELVTAGAGAKTLRPGRVAVRQEIYFLTSALAQTEPEQPEEEMVAEQIQPCLSQAQLVAKVEEEEDGEGVEEEGVEEEEDGEEVEEEEDGEEEVVVDEEEGVLN